jgi:predicted RNA-binding protein Jag
MPQQTLRQQLGRLRRELGETREIDDETRELLASVAREIEQTIEQRTGEEASVRTRLEEATYRFEAEHPDLARLLGEIGDTLAKLGI